jgi:hypothetical protein
MTPQLPHRTVLTAALAFTLAALLSIGSPAFALQKDLRSPDARDAAVPAAVVAASDDLRSADARDAGSSALPTVAPPTWPENPVPLTIDEPQTASSAPSGFEWFDAAVGAACTLGFMLLVAGCVALVSRRDRTPGGIAAS